MTDVAVTPAVVFAEIEDVARGILFADILAAVSGLVVLRYSLVFLHPDNIAEKYSHRHALLRSVYGDCTLFREGF
jgi:hypothetical protein